MPRVPVSDDISGQLIFLATGTSHGVPLIGCGCGTCTSPDPRNRRTRCAVVLGLPEGNLLIDTPPELRIQLLREGIGLIHAVLYTHTHADHLFGLDDLRVFPRYLGHELPVYCEQRTLLTHVCHALEHAATGAELPPGIDLAYDGLRIPLGIESGSR